MDYLFPNSRILIFAKAPVAGLAKTRLIPALSEAGAADLAEKLIHQIVKNISESMLCPVSLYCTPDTNHPVFKKMQQQYAVELHLQTGADLGIRMANALTESCKNAKSVIIIGTDCPVMNKEYLTEAFAILRDDNEIVFGPAEDGGYVLVGMNNMHDKVFQGIDWGTEKVMQQTRMVMQENNYLWTELATLWDVDRPEDLQRLTLGC